MVEVGQGNVGADASIFDGDDVLGRAVGGVAGHLPRPQLPAEADPPQQIQHGLVLHHLGRRDERGEDDPGLPAVDDVMVVVAQIQPATAVAHERGVRIGDAGAEVGHAPVVSPHYGSIGPTGLADPVVAMSRSLGQRGLRFSGEVDGQRRRAIPSLLAILGHLRRGEERTQVRLDGEARGHRIERGVGLDLGGVEVQLLAPDQPGLAWQCSTMRSKKRRKMSSP